MSDDLEKKLDQVPQERTPHIVKIIVACTHSKSGELYKVEDHSKETKLVATGYLCPPCMVGYKRIVHGYLNNTDNKT